MTEIQSRAQEIRDAASAEGEKPVELFPLAEPYPFDLVEEGKEC